MTDATLQGFRQIADALAGPEPRDWQWIGPHLSQRMFGITEARAKGYAQRHGGEARSMAHATDADCAPHLFPADPSGLLVQECSVCHVAHADPCGECGARGYHAAGCSEVA